MFKLTKNELANTGKCWYEDECKNSVFVKRKPEGFTVKIRFFNKNVTAEPLFIEIPISDGINGASLKLNYLNGKEDSSQGVSEGISGLCELINKWITLSEDICLLSANKSLLNTVDEDGNPKDASSEEICRAIFEKLAQYEEMQPLIHSV